MPRMIPQSPVSPGAGFNLNAPPQAMPGLKMPGKGPRLPGLKMAHGGVKPLRKIKIMKPKLPVFGKHTFPKK